MDVATTIDKKLWVNGVFVPLQWLWWRNSVREENNKGCFMVKFAGKNNRVLGDAIEDDCFPAINVTFYS
jgi:hypothetical protein